MNKLDRVEYEYQKAIELNPNNASLYNDYAVFLNRYRKDYRAALKYLNRAIKFEPDNKIYKLNFNKTIRDCERCACRRYNLFLIFLIGVMIWIGINEYTNIMNLLSLLVLSQMILSYQKNNFKKLYSYKFIID